MRRIKQGLLALIALTFTTTAHADITGTLFRDYNLNGTQDILEPGVVDLTVTAFDDAGSVSTATTDSTGSYTLVLPIAGKYRVEANGTPSYLNPGTAINGSTQPLVSFVDNGTTHDVGLSNAGEYCQANPDITLTRFVKGDRTSIPTNTKNAFIQYNYDDNGTTAPTDLVVPELVGSIYGVARFRKTNLSYVSSYFKRHSDLGPDGIGAIYKVDHGNANAVSLFSNLGGTDPRNAGVGYDWDHDTNGYADVGKVSIGDIELSDDETKLFAVNMEDRKLYVFNLDVNGDKTTSASYPIPKPCGAQTVADDSRPMGLGFNDGTLYVGVTCSAESTVSLDNVDDSYNGPRMGDSSKLSAHVYSFNPTTTTFSANPVLDIPLDYGRGCIFHADISNSDVTAAPPAGCALIGDNDSNGGDHRFVADWLPWQADYALVFNTKSPGNLGNSTKYLEYPQPLLSDIEFDNDGSMIVEIKDINGDRTGYENASPDLADGDNHNGNAMGDIIRACGSHQTGWTLESNGICGGVTTGGTNNNEGLGGGEFYWHENGPGGNGNVNGKPKGHADTVMGGMLQIAGYPDLVTTSMDIHDFFDNGLMWLRNDNGEISLDGSSTPKRLLVSEKDGNLFFGKASGLGDIEALCDPAPIEIGNYVWEDSNANGIQDPSEAALPDVTVELYDAAGLVGTAVTDGNGEYYFGGVNKANMVGSLPLKVLTDYQVRIILNEPDLGGRVPTRRDTNSNNSDTFDSDGDNGVLNNGYSTIAYTTGNVGQSNHTLDFGFVDLATLVSIGSTVFLDPNNNGQQEGAEAGISGLTVKLYQSNGTTMVATTMTDGNGDYYFGRLPAGSYVVGVTPSVAAPFSSTPTTDADDSVDGDDNGIQASSGDEAKSHVIVLSIDGESTTEANQGANTTGDDQDHADDDNGDMTVDFGFLTPAPSIDIEKFTNTDQAETPAAAVVLNAGDAVNWTYVVTNTGNVALTAVSVADNQGETVSCPAITLAVGANMTCTASNTAVAGNYANIGSVVGTPPTGANVTDSDPSHYKVIPNPVIDIEKATNTADADTAATAVVLNAGDAVTWSFVITNNGNETLNSISANDDKEGAITCPSTTLAAGASMTCTALTGTAVVGDYVNTASVSGTGAVSTTVVNDTDPSHYTVTPKVSIGNIIWNDNGAGDGTANDGIINGIETGIESVVVELYKTGEDPASTVATASTRTESDGTYVFDSLEEGTYFIHIPSSEFDTGMPLNTMHSSNGQGTTDDDDDGVDENGDDNETDGVSSPDYVLQAGTEPLGETGFSGIAKSTQDDNNTNMTVDFGFYIPASMGDKVWYDNNRDGIQDAGEDGVPNVKVYLLDENGNRVQENGNDKFVTTDASGVYSFTDLEPGDYSVEFDLSTLPTGGYVVSPKNVGNDKLADSDADTTTGKTEKTTLDAGENDPSWDMGIEQVLVSIGSVVWNDINDNGIQDAGESGIKDAIVTLLDSTGNLVTGVVVQTTQADGKYYFANLLEGSYKVQVTSPAGYAPSSVQNANVNDDKENDSNIKTSVSNVHTSDLIVLTNNNEPVETGTMLGDNADDASDDNNGNMTVDFGFTQSVKIGNLIWIEDDNDGDATTGTITHPPVGTLVTATASNGQTYTGTTDANGQYLIDVPKNDTYVITVATPTGFVPTNGSTDNSVPNTTTENNKTHNGAGTTVVIVITDNLTLDFGFTPPPAQSVKIGDLIWIEDDNDGDATTGTITHPPVGTIVTAIGSDGTTYTGTTDANGRYEIIVPENDTYTVTVATPTGVIPTLGSDDANISDTTTENNQSHDGNGTSVVVGTEDNLTVDFGFTPPPVEMVKIGNLIWLENDNDGDATTGTITYPPAGTIVTATATDGTEYTGTTDSKGGYSIIVPENDTYVVTVATPIGTQPSTGSDDNIVLDTFSEENKTHDGTGTTVAVVTEDNLTLDFGFTPLQASINIIKTVYGDDDISKGHDSGAGCGTLRAESHIVLVDQDKSKDMPVTYCFEVTNTGESYLTNIEIIDETLGITHGALTLLNGPAPAGLEPEASLLYYYEVILTESQTNVATVTAIPSDEQGNPSGETVTSKDPSTAKVTFIIDPPLGFKTVTASGNKGMEWQMVWINDSDVAAPSVTVFDEIPVGTHFEVMSVGEFVSASGVYCEARGTSITTVSHNENCYYEAPSGAYPRGRVIWKGIISADTEKRTEDEADNEVVIRFVSILDNPTLPNQEILNQGDSEWDFDNDGTPDIEVLTEGPTEDGGETAFTPANPIPTLSEWMLMLLALLLLVTGKKESMKLRGRKF